MSNYNVNLTDITDTRQVNVNVTTGDKGWSPELVMVRRESDGALVALREWIGGSGEKPTPPQYVAENGFTDDIEEAVNFKANIEDINIDENGDLIFTLLDGETINAGNAKGDPLPYSDWSPEDVDKLIQDVNINAQRIPAVEPGVLPTPSQADSYMVVTGVGDYTYGGATIGTNADGYQTTFWWDGSTWSNNGSVKVKGDDGKATEVWAAKSYAIGSTVYFGNSVWENPTTVAISGDVPGTSTVWTQIIESGDKDGYLVTNIANNGSFINADTNWLTNNATVSVTDGVAMVTPSAAPANTTTVHHIYQTKTLTLNNKYYVAAKIKGGTTLTVQHTSVVVLTNPTAGTWNTLDTIWTPNNDSPRAFGLRDSANAAFEVSEITLINLTAHFGAGKEPTIEEFRTMLGTDPQWNTDKKYILTNQFIYNELKAKDSATNLKIDSKFKSATNDLKNYNFETNLANASVPLLNNWVKFVGAANVTQGDFGYLGKGIKLVDNGAVAQKINVSAGDKLYISFVRNHVSGVPLTYGSFLRLYQNNNSIFQSFTTDDSSADNTWKRKSFISNPLPETEINIAFQIQGTTGFTVHLDSVVAINLTKIFGAGNEPLIDEMDAFIEEFPDFGFEGKADFIRLNDFRLRINALENEVGEAKLIPDAEKFYLADDFTGYFTELDRPYTDYSATISTLKHTDIYDLYDELMSEFPTYITMTIVGTVNTPDGIFEVRKYVFKPAATGTFAVNPPKIMIVAGQHGNEKHPVLATYNMMYDICKNWKQDERLRFLRFNTEFIIFPVLSTYGFDHSTRKNHNGVDINRNYSHGWYLQDPSAATYGGSAPFTEIESQAVRDAVLANMDLSLFIDFHNFASPSVAHHFLWTQSPNSILNRISSNYMRAMTSVWQKMAGVSQTDHVFGFVEVTNALYGSSEQYVQLTLGVNATLLEVDDNFAQQTGGEGSYSLISLKRAQEAITNFVLQNIKYLAI